MADIAKLRQWLEHWLQFSELQSDSMPATLRHQILDPLKSGDPVFAVGISRELLSPSLMDKAIRLLAPFSEGKGQAANKRILQCEIIFCLCKCPAPECRRYVSSMIPILLWCEWWWSMPTATSDSEEEDQSAVEVALLAIYHQDLSVHPNPPVIRLSSLASPSIYNVKPPASGSAPALGPDQLVLPDHLYPVRPIAKLDSYTRLVVVNRLCRLFQAYLSDVYVHSLIAYLLYVDRMVSVGTCLDHSQELASCLKSGSLSKVAAFSEDNQSSTSLVSLAMHSASIKDGHDSGAEAADRPGFEQSMVDFLAAAFLSPPPRPLSRFPPSESLYLLWVEAMVGLATYFPFLVSLVRRQLLRRSQFEVFPLAVRSLM